MLAQRHIHLVDADYSVHLNDPKVAQTLAFYVRLVAGDRQVGAESAADSALEMKDFTDGNLGAVLMPDWKAQTFRQSAPGLAGKMRIIPLPRFDASDAPTGSYGGTLIGIPRACRQPDQAWKLIEFLYLSPEGLDDRKKLGILPPIPEDWDDPEYHQPDSYFGGQKALEVYADLARQMPAPESTPVSILALGTLRYCQSQAVARVQSRGTENLEHQCQVWLDEAAIDLRRRIEHARFE
jgi:arabinosaccharide transport system substrate-binding protein